MTERRDEEVVTLIVVPEGGRGRSRQYLLSVATLRGAALGAALVVGLLLLGSIFGISRLGARGEADRLRVENIELRGELARIEGQMVEVERLMDRMRVVDAQLQGLIESDLLPGRGPLDEEEMALLGLEADEGDDEMWEGEDGEPMEELVDLELSPGVVHPIDSWASELEGRVELALRFMQHAEPRLYDVVGELEEISSISNALPQVWPVDGRLTSGYGFRRSPISRRRKLHGGIDLSAATGTPVYATAGGVVELSRYVAGYGRMVIIDHGFGVKSRYAHNSSLRVRSGTWVEAGQLIATVGSTGQSTGPHLHFELIIDDQRVDPLDYLPR